MKERHMTIKEVEKELGISRATVRFYEKNGLIVPARAENSYRDYSEEDVAELRRIIILRKLGISVDEISKLQQGRIDLSSALTENLERLNEQLKEVTGAIYMCKKLRNEGILMEDLNKVTYWEDIEKEESKGKLFMSIAEDIYVVAKHSFLSEFGIEDCEGNATKDAKGIIIMVISQCFACGIVVGALVAILEHKPFTINTFMEGAIWPFILMVYGFFIELPFHFLSKKYPAFAKKLKIAAAAIVIAGIVALMIYGLLGKN